MKKAISVLLTLVLLFSAAPAVLAASGTCGTNLSWNYTDGTLTISGSGTTMQTYSNYYNVPWYNTSYRTSIETIVFETTALEYISNNAFKNLTGLKTVILPDTVKKLGNYVFQGCSAIEDLTFPASIEELDVSCFNGAKIERLHIDGLQSIIGLRHTGVYNANNGIDTNPWGHAEAVYIDGTLTEDLVIPADMTVVPDLVFAGSPFRTLTVHENVTSIGNHAFYKCANLQTVSFAQNGALGSIGTSAFRECTSLTVVDLPGSVASLGEYCFYKNTSMNHVIIREGNLESLAAYSFADSKTLLIFECWPTLKTFENRATQNGTVVNGAKGHVYFNGVRNDSGIDGTEITQNGDYGDCSVPSVYYVWHYLQKVTVEHYEMDLTGTYQISKTEVKNRVGGKTIVPASFADVPAGMRLDHTDATGLLQDDETGIYTVPENDDARIKLYYARNTYTVRFEDEGGETLQSGTVYHGETPVFEGTLPQKEDTAQYTYSFYWRDTAAGGARYAADALPAASATVNYRAEFEATPKSYPVSVAAAEGITLTETPASPAPYGAAAVKFTVDAGFNADDLYVTVNGESVSPALADGVYTVTLFIEGETNVNIAFAVSSFTLTVHNGYNDTTLTFTGAEGETVTVAFPTRADYVFTGWTGDTANLNGTVYTFPAANEEITATWFSRAAADEALDAAGAVAEDPSYDADYRDTVADKCDELTDALAQVPASGTEIATLTDELNALISTGNLAENTLYTLTVKYGYTGAADTVITKKAGETVTVAYPVRADYVFTGWTGDTANLAGTTFTFAADAEITASWYGTAAAKESLTDAETLTNGDYDTDYKDALANAADELNNALNNVPADPGDLDNAVNALNTLIDQADAHALPVYTVTLSLNGGTYLGSGADITLTYTAQSEPFTLPENVIKKDFDFAGWYDGDGHKIESVDPAATQEDMYLTARWTLSDAALNKALADAAALIADPDDAYCASLADTLTPLVQQLTDAAAASPRDEDSVTAYYNALLAAIAAKDSHKHNWGDWTVTVEADFGTDGTQERVCSKCGAVQTRAYSLNVTPDRDIYFYLIERMHYILDIGTDEYAVFYNDCVRWYSAKALRFRVYAYTNFAYQSYIVYVNGVAVEPDADGWYTVPAGESPAVVSIIGAAYDQDSGEKLSFWDWLRKLFESIKNFFTSIFSR